MNFLQRLELILTNIRAWLRGENTCPKCGAKHYLMSFGIHEKICPDCYRKSVHPDLVEKVVQEAQLG